MSSYYYYGMIGTVLAKLAIQGSNFGLHNMNSYQYKVCIIRDQWV